MKKPTKEQVKRVGVKTVVATLATGQSLGAGKIVSNNWKKNKKKAAAFGLGSLAINIGLAVAEPKIEEKVVTFQKKPKTTEAKTDMSQPQA